MADLVAKTTDDIYYMLWGDQRHNAFTASQYDGLIDYEHGKFSNFKFMDMRQFRFEYYQNSINNIHHIQMPYYIRVVYPYLALQWGFPYDRDDFKIKKNADDEIDCSFLWYKGKAKWTVSIDQQIVSEHKGFDCLTNTKEDYPGDKYSAFHRIFSSSHHCCRIINESMETGRSICISGDSFMIPVIPILACYYKEVVFLDNRPDENGEIVDNTGYFKDRIFDQVVVALSEIHNLNKFLGVNLK